MHGRLTGLDGLRGIAALSVLLFHVVIWGGAVRGNAYLAVDFFFMLSGYVMARTYEEKMARGQMAPARFLIGRYRRFLPVMAAAGMIGLPCFLINHGLSVWPIAFANLLLIPTLQFDRLYPLNAIAWSILLELVANGVHAVLLRRLGMGMLVALVVVMASLMAVSASRIGLDVGGRPATMLCGVPRVLLSYMIGIMLWRWWRDRPAWTVSPMAALLAMPVFFGLCTLFDVQHWLIGMAFIMLGCPLLLAGGLRWQGCSPVMDLAGAMSFPLYAVHVTIGMTLVQLGLSVLWCVPASIGVAWLFVRLPAWMARVAARREGALA